MKVNTANRLGPIGIASLDLNTEEQNFTHNFIVCTKLKQHFNFSPGFCSKIHNLYRLGY